jgi:hypothetical protein
MIERQEHQKFGFIKTKQLEKVKVKQQLLMMMKQQQKLLSIGITVSFFSLVLFEIMYLFFNKNRQRSPLKHR